MHGKRIFGPRNRGQKKRGLRTHALGAAMLAATAIMLLPATAEAQSPALTSLIDGRSVTPDDLGTGEQAVAEGLSGSVPFAGYTLDLSSFSGAFGLSSEAAYLIVAEGTASVSGETARPGSLLILLPGRAGTMVEIFDAKRYAQSWDEADKIAHPSLYNALAGIARGQKWKIFFGRLSPTAFNLAAPGSGRRELARRSTVGTEAVQKIRFSGLSDPAAVEQAVVDTFTEALAAGDVDTVAGLLDPTPYGGTDITGGATDARQLVAQKLIQREAWGAILHDGAFTKTADAGVWQMATPYGEVVMRLTFSNDFIFVSNVRRGA